MSNQFKAILILSLLALNSECERVSINKVTHLEDKKLDLDESGRKACSALELNIGRLTEYLSSKVNKVETKGVAGTKGALRIHKLGQQTNALAATVKSFQEQGCAGDLSAASAQMGANIAVIKKLAFEGGETTSTLSTAISQAETEMAKPREEQDLVAIQASFMKTVLGGDGRITKLDRKIVIETEMTKEIVDDAFHETYEALLSDDESHDNVDDKNQVALFEQASANITSSMDLAESQNIFVTGLKRMTQFLTFCILAVLGLVWWIASIFGTIVAAVGAVLGAMVASIICAIWWLVGQVAEFVSLGYMKFGDDHNKCLHTIWVKPFYKPIKAAGIAVIWANPWEWMVEFVEGIDTWKVGKLE